MPIAEPRPTAEPLTASQPLPARRPALRAPPAKPPKRQAPAPVEYPESDGKPMAETPIHWRATVDFALPLMERYADRSDVYVGSDMLMYWVENDTDRKVSPDVFVAFGPAKEPERRVWKVWAEGKAADFVLEVTSSSTRGRDEDFKADLYEELEVTEYWQFDPTEDYLRPNLKGRRLGSDGAYEPVELNERDGALSAWSEVLGLELRPDGETLRLYDPVVGEYLPTGSGKTRIIGEKSQIIVAVKAERAAIAAERDTAKAERDAAKTRLSESEAQLDSSETARRAAEARIAELERRLAEVDE